MSTFANSEEPDEMPGILFSSFGRSPGAFQIRKRSAVNPQIGKLVIVYNYVIFGQ